MKTDISPAIIMRVKEFGESDLLVAFFTAQRGQLRGVAKGARRSRKRFVNALDLFSLVNLEHAPTRQGNLLLLHSAKLVDAYPGLRADFSALTRASFMIELTETLFPPGVAEPGMFELLKGSFDALSRGEKSGLIPLMFELKAMSMGGYRISTASCLICGRAYRGNGTAVFKRERGGITCLKCEKPSPLAPSLRPASVQTIRAMQESRLSEAASWDLDEETVKEVKNVLRLHREYRLEQKLRTTRYVD